MGLRLFKEAPGEWASRGACVGCDPDLFFPQRGASTRDAEAVCDICPVQYECREHGIRYEKFGIWGGTTERERRRIRRQRAVERQQVAVVGVAS